MNSALKIIRKGHDRPERHDSFTFTIAHPIDKPLMRAILRTLRNTIRENGFVTIRNLYEIVQPLPEDQPLVECHLHWGWTSLWTATIVTTEEAFHLSLPPALLIDDGTKR